MLRRLLAPRFIAHFFIAGLVLAGLVCASPAAAQEYPPQQEGVAASDTTVAPGQPITISGCCISGTVTITFDSGAVLATTTGDPDDGSFSAQVTIPSDATPGTHTISASGQAFDGSGPVVYSTTVTVAGAPAGDLPRTGSSSTVPLTRVAIVLVAVGSAFVVGARRRNASRARARVDA